MTSLDFAAAQERILARHQNRQEAKTRLEPQNLLPSFNASNGFPFLLNSVGLQAIAVWNRIKGREGTRPALRVGQVDAELLDEELLELLKAQVGDGLKLFGGHFKDEWSSEILLGLRAVLFKFTMWDHSASYGAALQNLKYTDARHGGPVHLAPSRWQKGMYGIFTVGGRYVWTRWEDWLAEQEGGYEEPNHNIRLLSQVSSFISTTHSIAAFASFLVFLVNGRYRTLLDRILCLRLAANTNQTNREISFEYLNRQLVWHAFTEFLLFLLPLVGISRWRRWLSRAWRKTKAFVRMNDSDEAEESSPKGELAFLPERTCAICYHDQNPTTTSENEVMAVTGASGGIIGSAQTDVTSPYQTAPCGCVYCFVCIATRLEAEDGEGWVCLRCGNLVKECRPWAGDVMEVVTTSISRKLVTFSDEGLSEEKQEAKDGDCKDANEKLSERADSDDGFASQEWTH